MDGILWSLLERIYLPGYVGVFFEHFHKCFLLALSGARYLQKYTNVLYQYCPRQEGLRRGASAQLPGRRPPPLWTGRGQLNKGVMFGELRVLLFLCFRSVHGWMGMDV